MGTGILDITTRCVDYGLPEPEFKMRDGFVAIIYRKKGLAFEKVNTEITEKTDLKTVEKTTEKILKLIKEDPQISQEKIAEFVGITTDGVFWNIKKLKAKGLIKRIGPDKGGYWEVVK